MHGMCVVTYGMVHERDTAWSRTEHTLHHVVATPVAQTSLCTIYHGLFAFVLSKMVGQYLPIGFLFSVRPREVWT